MRENYSPQVKRHSLIQSAMERLQTEGEADVTKKYQGKEQATIDSMIKRMGLDRVQMMHDNDPKAFDKAIKYKSKPGHRFSEGIPKSTMYGLVIDGEYVAKGSKADMMKMKKEKGGTVYNAPGKKVGDKAGVVKEGEAGDHDRMYKVVHVKKGVMDIKAKTSYEAAKKFAKEKGLKSTAGVDTHLYPLDEGYKVLPNIDKERYTEMPGLEGPFQTMSGKPIYYDPKEGAYYDRDTDMYLTYDEFKALDEGRKKNKNPMGPQGITPGDRVEHEGDMYQVVAVDGDILTVDNLQNGNRTQFRMDDVTRLFGADAMTDQDEEDLEAMFKRLDKTPSGSLKHVATEAMTDKEVNDFHNALDKVVHKHIGHSSDEDEEKERLTKKVKEGNYPSKLAKGHKNYKAQQAAVAISKQNSSLIHRMRDALKLDESTDADTVIAEYTRATLDGRHNTWGKVCKQIDYIRSLVKEDINLKNVKGQILRMHEKEALDRKLMITEDIQKLRDIVKDKSAMSIKFSDGSMKVDMTTASIFLQVFDKVKEETQAKIIDRIQTKSGFLSVLDKMYSMIG